MTLRLKTRKNTFGKYLLKVFLFLNKKGPFLNEPLYFFAEVYFGNSFDDNTRSSRNFE